MNSGGARLAISLVGLLGDTRAALVEVLQGAPASVAELADALALSDVAVRRHLQVLERDGLVEGQTVRGTGRGRPGTRYSLTDKGRRLFPDRSAELANDLLGYLEAVHGRAALRDFLRWRAGEQETRYAAAVSPSDPDAGDEPGEALSRRVAALAEVLSEDGFAARAIPVVSGDGSAGMQLTQGHCAVADVAREHPEICAYEAALFQRVLGAKVSRRETIAGGASACVCHISKSS